MREDQAEAAAIDAELDARDAARAAAAAMSANGSPADDTLADGSPADGGSPAAGTIPADDHPWWETDPRFTERFGKA